MSNTDQPEKKTLPTGEGRDRRGALLICAAVVVCYGRVLRAPFVFDDLTAIVHNPYLESLWPPNWFWGSPEQTALSTRPLTALTFALNYAVGGLDPYGYHLVNSAIHTFSACIVLLWLRRTWEFLSGIEVRASFFDAPFFIALLWAVHPLSTDAVTYVTQRTELLASACYLTVMYAAARAPTTGWSRWNTLAVVACALGMASKEIVVSAPLMVPLYDRAFRFSTWREAWTSRRRFYFALAAGWLLLFGLMLWNPRDRSAGFDVSVSSWDYLLTQCTVLPRYLFRCFAPIGLSIDYGTDFTVSWTTVAAGSLLLFTLAAATLTAWRRFPPFGFAGAWFFLILAPTSSLVPISTEPEADRRMYLPLIAVLAVTTVVAVYAVQRLRIRGGVTILRAAAVAAIVAAAASTVVRNETFRSVVDLWADAAQKRPVNPRALHNLACALAEDGRLGDAIETERRAVELQPLYPQSVKQLASWYDTQGLAGAADSAYRRALELHPEHVGLLLDYADRLATENRWEEAESLLRRAAAITPQNPVVQDHVRRLREARQIPARR